MFSRNLKRSKSILLSSSFSHVDRSDTESSSRNDGSSRLNLSSSKLRVIRAGPSLYYSALTLDADLMIDVRGIMSLACSGAITSDRY